MIENTIKHANENSLLKRMNSRIKEKQKNIDYNKKRYWKLSALERLHYDSRAEKINKNNAMFPFHFSLLGMFLYFSVLVIFTLFKVLFNVDPSLLVNSFLLILGTAPFFFKVAIIVDIFFIFLTVWVNRKAMKKLNKNYGFKKV